MTTPSLLRAAVLCAALFAVTALPAQSAKIAVFDPQRVSEETEEGQRIAARLAAFQTEKQAELTALENEITAMQDQLQKGELSLSAERRAALQADIQSKIVELQSKQDSANKQFQLEIARAQSAFQQSLLLVIDEFGRQEGFDLILDVGTTAFSSAGIDVTTAIVDRFNIRFADPAGAEPAGDAAGGDAAGGGE